MNIKTEGCDSEKPHAHQLTSKSKSDKAKKIQTEYMRAPNEDDDGYDPYSDRPAVNPMFEEDPWR